MDNDGDCGSPNKRTYHHHTNVNNKTNSNNNKQTNKQQQHINVPTKDKRYHVKQRQASYARQWQRHAHAVSLRSTPVNRKCCRNSKKTTTSLYMYKKRLMIIFIMITNPIDVGNDVAGRNVASSPADNLSTFTINQAFFFTVVLKTKIEI
jgi:hypothetical protein